MWVVLSTEYLIPLLFIISLKSRAEGLQHKQKYIPWPEKDYGYIDLFRKAYENETQPLNKAKILHELRGSEAMRDFFTGSVRQIQHLIQLDPTPNLELKTVRREIYKISISFEPKCTYLWIVSAGYESLE